MGSCRQPAVAGAFYPAGGARLAETVAALVPPAGGAPARPARGVMVPHAGYVYSGACAAKTLAGVEIPPTVLLLGPNHTGRGAAISAAPHADWLTPLGKCPLDRALLDALAARDAGVVAEPNAHLAEHSLEVQVPLLQTLRPGVAIAPLVVGTQRLDQLLALGEAIAAVLASHDRPVLIAVSSDMTHYEPAAVAQAKDERALARLAELDPEGLHRTVREGRITMCGVAPAVAALAALRVLGATRGTLVEYTHSGRVTGDEREVVAYAGMVFD